MKRTPAVILAVILAFSLCSCAAPYSSETNLSSQTEGTQTSAAGTESSVSGETQTEEIAYPYVDTEGRTRYQLYFNGELVETQHDPYTYASEPNGAYYPIVEIFEQLGVECLFDESLQTLTTKVNGTVITCSSGNKDITVGKKTLGGTAPEYIDGCFYVPSFTFMELLDAVVDFNSDRSGVTITTDLEINAADSGTAGLSISADTAGKIGEKLYSGSDACAVCGGTGKCLCARCSGTGSVTQYLQTRNPATGQMTVTNTKATCTACGGSGKHYLIVR